MQFIHVENVTNTTGHIVYEIPHLKLFSGILLNCPTKCVS